jgi:ubiquitin carboxyl-terminal hydrolase 10
MREYKVIDSATSVEQLKLRLKDSELEQYGEAFTPDFVYDVIKRLPRFVTMRVSSGVPSRRFINCLLPAAWSPARRRRIPWFPS